MKIKVAAPVSLTGLFVHENDSDEDGSQESFQNECEVVPLNIGGIELNIRQKSWHQANANQVWPGTFTLIEHIFNHDRYKNESLLELGSATGALAIALLKTGNYHLDTSDIDDLGDVEQNIAWNCENNGVETPHHIAHTWGTGWKEEPLGIKYIVASDILLYVSAYKDLVDSLCAIFDRESNLIEFLMSWNRRINQSYIFFDLMKEAGFCCHNHGKGIYSFYRTSHMDEYLASLSSQGLVKSIAS